MPVTVGREELLVNFIYKFVKLSALGWPAKSYVLLTEEVNKTTENNYHVHKFFQHLIKYLSPRVLPSSEKYREELDYLTDHVLLKIVAWLATSKETKLVVFRIIQKCKRQFPTCKNLRYVTRRLVLNVMCYPYRLNYSSPDSDETDTDNDYSP